MTTQQYNGRNSLLKRLSAQVGGNEEMARKILIDRGHMIADGKLTAAGQKRDSMTAEERAIDRASKRAGGIIKDYTYNPASNTASLRRR
jgi:hypothetical protein